MRHDENKQFIGPLQCLGKYWVNIVEGNLYAMKVRTNSHNNTDKENDPETDILWQFIRNETK